jgi:hypothetical protein
MAKRKAVVRLLHKKYGEVVIQSSFLTADGNEKCFTALSDDGEKQLLAEHQYWLSTPAEVDAAFAAFTKKALAEAKDKRAKERKRDLYDGLAKNIKGADKLRIIAADEAEIRELEIETDDPQYAEAEY